jgi:hypothetical protein
VHLAGTTVIDNNIIVRGGCLDPNWNFGVGALWFYALDAAMSGAVQVSNCDIVASPFESIHFIGNRYASSQGRKGKEKKRKKERGGG